MAQGLVSRKVKGYPQDKVAEYSHIWGAAHPLLLYLQERAPNKILLVVTSIHHCRAKGVCLHRSEQEPLIGVLPHSSERGRVNWSWPHRLEGRSAWIPGFGVGGVGPSFAPAHTLYTHYTHILGTPSALTTKPIPTATYSQNPTRPLPAFWTDLHLP